MSSSLGLISCMPVILLCNTLLVYGLTLHWYKIGQGSCLYVHTPVCVNDFVSQEELLFYHYPSIQKNIIVIVEWIIFGL